MKQDATYKLPCHTQAQMGDWYHSDIASMYTHWQIYTDNSSLSYPLWLLTTYGHMHERKESETTEDEPCMTAVDRGEC